MTLSILIAFVALYAILILGLIYYMKKVVQPVNREMKEASFSHKADALHEKINAATTYDDCRRINSNIIAFQRVYNQIICERRLAQTVNSLFGALDGKEVLLLKEREQRLKRPELGTLTVEQLLKLNF